MSDEKTGASNPMEDLLAELETLAKAMPAANEAKGEDGEDDIKGEEGEDLGKPDGGEEGEEKDGDGDGEAMGKSFKAVIDGEEKEVVDGTELVKALIGRLDNQEGVMAKALGHTVEMLKSQGDLLKSQAGEINALRAEVGKLAGTPAGRKSTLTVNDKQAIGDLAKANGDTGKLTAGDLMAKANSAAEAGRMSWRDVAAIDAALRIGAPPDRALVTKALAA